MKHTEYIIPIGEEAEDFDEIFIGVLRKHKELIRCKDCAFCRTFYHGLNEKIPFSYRCGKLCLYTDLSPDDYCSRAMRKE